MDPKLVPCSRNQSNRIATTMTTAMSTGDRVRSSSPEQQKSMSDIMKELCTEPPLDIVYSSYLKTGRFDFPVDGESEAVPSTLLSNTGHRKKMEEFNSTADGELHIVIAGTTSYAMQAAAAGDAVIVGGKAYSKQQCFIRALELDQTNSMAWKNLGDCLGAGQAVTVNGVPYTKTECYLLAKKGR